METDLLTKLLRLSLSAAADPETEQAPSDLPETPEPWEALSEEARNHRLEPLFGFVLSRRGLLESVPQPFRTSLLQAYRQTLRRNMLHCWVVSQLLPILEQKGIAPILFKGIVLCDAYYPDIGARPMADVDLLIEPPMYEATVEALERCGCLPEHPREGHATAFCGPTNMAIDLHEVFTLFPPEEREQVTEELLLPSLGGQAARTWEPNAMLIHLVVHLTGHRPKTGLLLGWLVDMAFLVQQRGGDLDQRTLEQLAPRPVDLALLWRILGYLQAEWGLSIPPHLSAGVAGHPPLSIGGILRDRRLALWKLPRLRGWVKLLAAGIGARQRPTARLPRVSDLALGLLPGGRD